MQETEKTFVHNYFKFIVNDHYVILYSLLQVKKKGLIIFLKSIDFILFKKYLKISKTILSIYFN